MDKMVETLARRLNLNSVDEIWRFFGCWLFMLWVLPCVVLVALLDGIALIVVVGVAVIGLIKISLFSRIVRKHLVLRGAKKSQLDAISKVMGRAFAVTLIVAIPIMLAVFFAIEFSAKLIGVWDRIDEVNFLGRVATVLILFGLANYLGWVVWGKKVYNRRASQLETSSTSAR